MIIRVHGPPTFIARWRLLTPKINSIMRKGIALGRSFQTERGSNGFGYDPIFLLPEVGLTMAELSMEQKNRLSHRARAIKAALPILQGVFSKIKSIDLQKFIIEMLSKPGILGYHNADDQS